ncbi:nuclear transport factor 2 family protein [Bradyrhizobium sp. AZCC 2230]|uniref:nuclear transport factor 2 family protein n=1 Tax=Bradyrhizobium sp. AZCC 2230 TaxID=3117021 RepID=UPI002FF18805
MQKSDIDELEQARRSAMLAADLAGLDRLFADDLVWIHASSKSDTKKSLIGKFASGSLRCHRLDHSEVAICIYDSVAIVRGKLEMDVLADGTSRTSVNLFTGVWAGALGATKLVLWQSTRVQS